MEPQKILLYPLVTEKSTGMVDTQNKLTFIVAMGANKNKIRESVEKLYNVKVSNVSTLITTDGRKKAIVQLSKEYSAIDIMTKMGVL